MRWVTNKALECFIRHQPEIFDPPMSSIIRYTNCPVCNSASVNYALSAKDYTVSQKQFEIWQCSECRFRFTQNIPTASNIGQYYQSENYISHTNTNKGLVNQLYHRIRSITLRQKKKLIQASTNKTTGSLLDVGAGTGAFAAYIRSSGWQLTGLEPDETARRIAKETNGISLLPSDQLFQLPTENYDAITLWHVLEHVHDLHEYMMQFRKLLKPGGRLLIAVPNYTSKDAEIYQNYWAAYDVPRHLYHFSPDAMRQLIKQHGLVLQTIKPMWFDSFYVSMLSEKYKAGKTSLLKGAWNGFRSNVNTLFNKERCSSLIYVIGR